jgi:hypothetical protein
MYRSLRPLEKASDLARMPALEGLLPRSNPISVPVAPVEVPLLMERFPIAWRRDAGSWDLVAITGLTPEQESWRPALGDSGSRVIPLVLRAYPLAIADSGDVETLPVLVDEAGLLPAGAQPSGFDADAAEADLDYRLQAIWTFGNSRKSLQGVYADIAEAKGFAPWPLSFAGRDRNLSLDGFWIVDWRFIGSPAHAAIVSRHGWLAASLISMHRISTHRINALLHDLARQTAA